MMTDTEEEQWVITRIEQLIRSKKSFIDAYTLALKELSIMRNIDDRDANHFIDDDPAYLYINKT